MRWPSTMGSRSQTSDCTTTHPSRTSAPTSGTTGTNSTFELSSGNRKQTVYHGSVMKVVLHRFARRVHDRSSTHDARRCHFPWVKSGDGDGPYDTSVRNFAFLPGTRSGTRRTGGSLSRARNLIVTASYRSSSARPPRAPAPRSAGSSRARARRRGPRWRQQISAYWYIAMRAAIGFRRRRRLMRNLPRYKTRRIVPSKTPTTVPMILTIFKIASPPPPLSPTPLTL
jgi:hypothetical protein